MTRKIRIKKEEVQEQVRVQIGVDPAEKESTTTVVQVSGHGIGGLNVVSNPHIPPNTIIGISGNSAAQVTLRDYTSSLSVDTASIREMVSSEMSRMLAADTDRAIVSSLTRRVEPQERNPTFPCLVSFDVQIGYDARTLSYLVSVRGRFDRRGPQVYQFHLSRELAGRTGSLSEFVEREVRPGVRDAISQIALGAYEEEVVRLFATEFGSVQRL